jgi:hypothetical protein
VLPEPVSPELVLIDPELARRERARLEERAVLAELKRVEERARIEERARLAAPPDIPALRRALEHAPAPAEETSSPTFGWREVGAFSRRRLLPAALMLSLFANGIVLAEWLARNGGQKLSQERAAVRIETGLSSTSPSAAAAVLPAVGPPTSAVPKKSAAAGKAMASRASVERRLASLIISSPARKLPAQFRDATTGLVRNNVQVVCRARAARSYLCLVRLGGRPPGQGVYVRYRQGRSNRGVFTWYGYRKVSPS